MYWIALNKRSMINGNLICDVWLVRDDVWEVLENYTLKKEDTVRVAKIKNTFDQLHGAKVCSVMTVYYYRFLNKIYYRCNKDISFINPIKLEKVLFDNGTT